MRPRRSCLYMPGSNQRALEKARTLAADAVIFDLEDAVAPTAKSLAREQILQALKQGGYGQRELVVRINAGDTEWYLQDVAALADAGADALLLPKVNNAADIHKLSSDLVQNTSTPPALWAMVETPQAITQIESIAAAGSGLAVLVMGLEDLSKETRIPHTVGRCGFQYALSRTVMAARAAGVDVLDGVYTDIADSEGFMNACEQSRALGFDGRSLIHPSQIDVANDCFAPDEAAVANARAILEAWSQAEVAGAGVAVLNNRLVEQLHVEQATALLQIHQAITALTTEN